MFNFYNFQSREQEINERGGTKDDVITQLIRQTVQDQKPNFYCASCRNNWIIQIWADLYPIDCAAEDE